MNVKNFKKKIVSEQATGCSQYGSLSLYDDKGNKLTTEEAKEHFYNGRMIEVPTAGAGSYIEFLRLMGFDSVEEICTSSSAGDWSFGAKTKDGWFFIGQENRYPYYGFRYTLSINLPCCETFEILCELVC